MKSATPTVARLWLAGLLAVALALGGCFSGGATAPEPSDLGENFPETTPAPTPQPLPYPVQVLPPIPPPQPAPPPPPQPTSARVALGIDVLAAHNFAEIQGQRVGLLTNQAGVNRDGVSTIDILRRAPGVNLVALFAPEHGIDGKAEATQVVADTTYKNTGLPVHSLYGTTRKPTTAMLQNIDVVVIDLQDIGTRSYTFISCMLYTMEACFELHKTVVVLDRPNPLGGLKVGGPMMEDKWMSYVGAYRVPYVYGLTIGELAQMAHDNPGWLDVPDDRTRANGKLIVIPMNGWRRSMTWQDTGLKWVQTSPYIPTVGAAFGYAMAGLAGWGGNTGIPTLFAHGVGSEYPFRFLNYPGHKPADVAAALNKLNLAGLEFVPKEYVDDKGVHAGVYLGISDWNAVDPTRLAFEMMKLDAAWNPKGNPFAHATGSGADLFEKHVGSTAWFEEISTKGKNADVAKFFRTWDAQDAAFQQWSQRWWLYAR